MSIASGTLTLARATASTAVHAAEAAGGAAVGAVTGAARGTVAGGGGGAYSAVGWGPPVGAARLRAQAAELAARFDEAFWLPQSGWYAMA
ncbi:hypothetical protein, partial [Nocardia wallacei]|uniref:hypothetical protein n=1 Tax=Nocardia wallacei TaxID=480035 RepID=UPI002453B906